MPWRLSWDTARTDKPAQDLAARTSERPVTFRTFVGQIGVLGCYSRYASSDKFMVVTSQPESGKGCLSAMTTDRPAATVAALAIAPTILSHLVRQRRIVLLAFGSPPEA